MHMCTGMRMGVGAGKSLGTSAVEAHYAGVHCHEVALCGVM